MRDYSPRSCLQLLPLDSTLQIRWATLPSPGGPSSPRPQGLGEAVPSQANDFPSSWQNWPLLIFQFLAWMFFHFMNLLRISCPCSFILFNITHHRMYQNENFPVLVIFHYVCPLPTWTDYRCPGQNL